MIGKEEKLSDLFWASKTNLAVDKPLSQDDKLWVDTEAARGQFSFNNLKRQLGIDPKKHILRAPEDRQYILFAGHVGCGKSTELRRFVRDVESPDMYHVVFIDSLRDLDTNNLQYVDVLFVAAQSLCKGLAEKNIEIKPIYLSNLQNWFAERIQTKSAFEDITTTLDTGAEAKAGLPFLGELFAKLSTGLKAGASYKDELRQTVRNSFNDFAKGFNQLVSAAEEELKRQGLARKILFAIDGTDRLDSEDTNRFFIEDVHQLKQVEGNFIYTARINLLYDTIDVKQLYNDVFVVPMIKLEDRNGTRQDVARDTLRKFVFKRVDRKLFDSCTTADYLIENCGGHPRDLVRLLHYTFQVADANERFDRAAADQAVRQLATDYKRLLDADDYKFLAKLDAVAEPQQGEKARRLLRNSVILEYNSFWWRSHPAVRTLPGYEEARAARAR